MSTRFATGSTLADFIAGAQENVAMWRSMAARAQVDPEAIATARGVPDLYQRWHQLSSRLLEACRDDAGFSCLPRTGAAMRSTRFLCWRGWQRKYRTCWSCGCCVVMSIRI